MAVAYLRVSTEEQHNGPEAQRFAIEAWAARQHVTIVAWHREEVSGGAPLERRLELVSAIAALREHKAGLLVAAKRDRIARDAVLAVYIERMVANEGAQLVTADGVTAEDSPEGRLVRGVLDLFAEYERAQIKARTKAALAAKRRRGEHVGGMAPFGYAVSRVTETAKLEPVEDEQAVIRMIWKFHREGIGSARIARRLNKAGVPCRGAAWHPTSVQRVLGRPA